MLLVFAGSAMVQVSLLDVNDNGPVFHPSNLTAYVYEDRSAPQSVTTLLQYTTDPDLPPNQGPFRYTSISGPHNNVFSIFPETGLVKTKIKIDREVNPEFIIPVIVTTVRFK